jgi:hypothetical protein
MQNLSKPITIAWDRVDGAVSYCVVIAGGGQLVHITQTVIEERVRVRLPLKTECLVSVTAWNGHYESEPTPLMDVYANRW